MANIKIISKANHFNQYLNRYLNEFEVVEIPDMLDGCFVPSNFGILSNFQPIPNNQWGCVVVNNLPACAVDYWKWLVDANGYKIGIAEISEAEKQTKQAEKKAAKQYELRVERDRLFKATDKVQIRYIRKKNNNESDERYTAQEYTQFFAWVRALEDMTKDAVFQNTPENFQLPDLPEPLKTKVFSI